MAILILRAPLNDGLAGVSRLVWSSSQALLGAARSGNRARAEALGIWLANTREDRRCTPTLARTIDSALEIALRSFGGTSQRPRQGDDGAAA